jgi:hypothetical protein
VRIFRARMRERVGRMVVLKMTRRRKKKGVRDHGV